MGLPPESIIPWEVMEILGREIDVRGVFRYANCFADCVRLIADGRIDLDPMVTGRYPLEQAPEAFDFASTRKGECIKLVVEVGGG